MKLGIPGNDTIAAMARGRPRCICCIGVIELPSNQDASPGLDMTLGLVSDECALICNDCTSRLIATRQANKLPPRGRR